MNKKPKTLAHSGRKGMVFKFLKLTLHTKILYRKYSKIAILMVFIHLKSFFGKTVVKKLFLLIFKKKIVTFAIFDVSEVIF